MRRYVFFLCAIFLVALMLRVASVGWNTVVHGDIGGDVSAAVSFYTKQQLIVGDPTKEITGPHFIPAGIARHLLIAHPPIWAIAGAATLAVLQRPPTFDHAYVALQILSLVCGIVVIALTSLIALRRFGEKGSLWIALWLAASYLMIDYSGNGALYSLQAASYLVWILVADAKLRWKPLWLGIVTGLGYLVNHQAIVLIPASGVVLLFDTQRTWRQRVGDISLMVTCTFLVALPWLLRNKFVFGSLFFSHTVNSTYVYVKASVPTQVIGDRIVYVLDTATRLSILKDVLFTWLPNNLYYIARKLFILAPIIFFFFSFAWVDYLFSRERFRAMLPIIAICVFHILISAAWPVTKFRYFVPLLPLVLLIGYDQLHNLKLPRQWQAVVVGTTTCAIIALSYLTYLSVPTHTYYYDGAITQDPFHGRGEYEYILQRIPPPE